MCRTLSHACSCMFPDPTTWKWFYYGSSNFFLKKNDILYFNYITKCNDLAVCVELLAMRINACPDPSTWTYVVLLWVLLLGF